MNDFEQKLAGQTFREPPAALRAEILRACAAAPPAAWTWRDWLWPAPQAWATLAALWLIFGAMQLGDHSASLPAPFATPLAPGHETPAALFSMHHADDFRHVLDLAN